jgi:hypothetical protein
MKEKSFSKKKLITDFLNFDWKSYVDSYDDLNFLTTKEDAWYHWINYGKHENRVVNQKNNGTKTESNVKKNSQSDKEYEKFDWLSYIINNEDLSYIDSKEDAWKHWLNHGMDENRIVSYSINDEEFVKFDWKSYVNIYDDLSYISSKEEAWKHWLSHGKNENRIISNSINDEEFENFDWEIYVSNYEDLLNINSKEEAWNHWLSHGKNENRIRDNIFLYDDYKTFDWKQYINNYDDLTYIDSEEEAWKHFILYGFNEGRKLNDVKEIEENEYKKIVEDEEEFETIDFSLNKLYFKKKYTNCGKHYFGWKSSINYFLDHSNFDNLEFNSKYYFDEWIEKLLVWGNKIQNKKCLDIINDENIQLITFLHGPPFENYNSELDNKNFILNDDSLLNKNIIDLINNNNLLYSISFLYVLSIHHKNYIVNTYPQLKNKVLSVYHPIDINDYEKNDLFNIRKFMNKRNIYHIGWWLRNFTSFFDFKIPKGYNKLILVKQEFRQQFDEKFTDVIDNDKNIQVINELNDDEYKNVFSSSCIFCDLADAIANNIVLECIKYNTPIIIKRIPSIEEYLGIEYPLFFEDTSELSKFTDSKYLHTKIVQANEYLQKMDKRPYMLETFLNKVTYDIHKLKNNNDKCKLTWLYYLNDENIDIEKYISFFNNQLSIENIKLILVNALLSKVELLEKYNSDNITIINVDTNLDMNEVYNIFVENSTTEFLTFKNFNNIYNEENYSDLCINYLENNPTYDIILFKNNKIHNDKIIENIIQPKKILEINNDDSSDSISSSDSSDPSNNLSETSYKMSDSSKNKLFDIDDSKLDTEDDINDIDHVEIDDDTKDIDVDIDIDYKSEVNGVDNDSISDMSDDIVLENKLEEDNSIQNTAELLNYSQIYTYNFDDVKINILWRKSIHSFIDKFDDNFWFNCNKNHLNIFEINYNNLIN